jgi:hypothetical protein
MFFLLYHGHLEGLINYDLKVYLEITKKQSYCDQSTRYCNYSCNTEWPQIHGKWTYLALEKIMHSMLDVQLGSNTFSHNLFVHWTHSCFLILPLCDDSCNLVVYPSTSLMHVKGVHLRDPPSTHSRRLLMAEQMLQQLVFNTFAKAPSRTW